MALGAREIAAAIERVAAALDANKDRLTELDQAVGDGDLGITAGKIAGALREYTRQNADEDLGRYVTGAGLAVNRAASSSLGTLLATALMRAGKEVRGKAELEPGDLVTMLRAADTGIQERGKAKPGDKTIIDALHPAAEAFDEAMTQGDSLDVAASRMISAAQDGLDTVTPVRSKIGRAGWIGERTEGKVDPGCAACLIILQALAG
jgi:phosphoenolpyruvate---glycerone phosphotransferase subunit DhaL